MAMHVIINSPWADTDHNGALDIAEFELVALGVYKVQFPRNRLTYLHTRLSHWLVIRGIGPASKVSFPIGKGEFFIESLMVRIHLIIGMIRWSGLAP